MIICLLLDMYKKELSVGEHWKLVSVAQVNNGKLLLVGHIMNKQKTAEHLAQNIPLIKKKKKK